MLLLILPRKQHLSLVNRPDWNQRDDVNHSDVPGGAGGNQ